MQENVQHIIPTGDLLDSNKSTISRKSNFGDLLVFEDRLLNFFSTVEKCDFLDLTNKYPIRPIDSPIHGVNPHIS